MSYFRKGILLAVAVLLVGTSYAASPLPRDAASNHGISPDVIAKLTAQLDTMGTHSMMIMRDNVVIAEGWWKPFAPQYTHTMYSVSKSFTSMAMAFAIQEGLLTLDTKISDIIPYANLEERNRKVTIRDLMTMSMGYVGKTDHDFFHSADWLNVCMHTPLEYEPGTHFAYDNRCAYLCSAAIQRITGKTLYEYLKPRLFKPLGITHAQWEIGDGGINPGGWGLNITTEELARFGTFLLNKGKWQGKQLLDSTLIQQAVSRKIMRHRITDPDNDWQRGYGYFFWQCYPEGIYRADGALGQCCVVMPNQNMVVVVTAGTLRLPEILRAIWKTLLPAVDHGTKSTITNAQLNAQLQALSKPYTQYSSSCINANSGVYAMEKNELNIDAIKIEHKGKYDVLTLCMGTLQYKIRIGEGWTETNNKQVKFPVNSMCDVFYPHVAATAANDGNSKLTIQLAYTRSSYIDELQLQFSGNKLNATYICKPTFPLRDHTVKLIGTKVK